MNIKYKILFQIVIALMLIPFVGYAQHYIIEDIPDLGDDGVHLKVQKNNTVSAGSKEIIEVETIEDVTVETTITETITQNKTTAQTISIVGTVAGSALALTATTVPLFATTPTMAYDLIFLNVFGLFARKAGRRKWGTVFDYDTKRPIPAVKITLFDEQLKELETTYSDKEGRFGFLANAGVYNIEVYKKDYELFTDENRDVIYGDIYDGKQIEISDKDVLNINIALKSTRIDWQEYADKKIREYTSIWSLVKKYLVMSLYFIGYGVTVLVVIFYTTPLNIFLVSINTAFFIYIFFVKEKKYGTVITSGKKPVPFAVVSLYDKEGKKDAFAVTDVIGRYYMLADNGSYTMKVSGQSLDQQKKSIEKKIHVRDKMVSKDIIFEEE